MASKFGVHRRYSASTCCPQKPQGPRADPTWSSMGLALGFPTLTPNPQPHLLLLSCKTIKAWALPCLAASTPGNTLREMSTAGTGNSTEPLLGRGLGRPAGRQEQNLKGRECERAEDMAQWHTACHGCLRSPPSAQDQKEEKRKKQPADRRPGPQN